MRRVVLWVPALLCTAAVVIYFRLYFLIDSSSVVNEKNKNHDAVLNRDENLAIKNNKEEILRAIDQEPDEVNIVVVVCGQRSEEALAMIKSAVIFQKTSKLHFILLSEFNLQNKLNDDLLRMQSLANNSFTYQLLNLSFPAEREKEWRNLFQPCAAQRLFLPNVLSNISKILYVDTDVLFLNDLSDIWRHFNLMNSSQMSAVAPEHEEPNTGWYNRFAKHPFYGQLGINSGVMLMHLMKMREFRWVDYLSPILTKFKLNLTWGDQDIINIIFSYYPDKLYVYSCRYNYRTDHCVYKSVCKDAEVNGISVLHGSRGAFHSDKQEAFKALHRAFSEYVLGTDINERLLKPLKVDLEKTRNTTCGEVINISLKKISALLSKKETG